MQGIDPRMAEIAMEQMRRMSPEQLAQLQQSMGNMNPAMMQQAMDQMKNMSSTDWDRAKQQINSMGPEDLTKQATEAAAHMNSQQQYIFNASVELKNEGNKLHSAGKYTEAVEKYERAKNNVTDFPTAEATNLRKACVLNLSSCYLNLERYDDCIRECDNVLQGEADSLKALYRRGQAYAGKKMYAKAVKDLRKAVRLSEHDPTQRGIIKAKLEQAEEKLEETGAFVSNTGSTRGPPVSSVIIEEVEDEEPPKVEPAAPTPSPASASSPASFPPKLDAAMRRQAAELMNNPGMMKQVSSMMSSMSDEQIEAMSKQMGVPLNKDMVKLAQQQMQNMDPQQLQQMMSTMDSSGGFPATGAMPSMPAQDPETIKKAAEAMQKNPEMVKMAAEMMRNMSPEQINQMCGQAGGQLPVTPEMAKQAAEQLSRMSPEQVAEAAKMAAAMQSGGTSTSSSTAAGSSPSTTVPSSSVQTAAPVESTSAPAGGPNAAEFASMAKVMADMDPEQLAAMGEMAGGGMTPDMAKAAAEMMKSMSPDDLERMSRMAMSMGMAPPGMPPVGGAAPSPAGMSQADMAKMASQMDPAMMESAVSMMRNMDDDSLISMMMSSGMCSDRAQAEVMAKQMKGMSDTQMQMMMKAATAVQTAAAKFQQVKEYARQHKLLMLSIVVVLIALLLRTFGYL